MKGAGRALLICVCTMCGNERLCVRLPCVCVFVFRSYLQKNGGVDGVHYIGNLCIFQQSTSTSIYYILLYIYACLMPHTAPTNIDSQMPPHTLFTTSHIAHHILTSRSRSTSHIRTHIQPSHPRHASPPNTNVQHTPHTTKH